MVWRCVQQIKLRGQWAEKTTSWDDFGVWRTLGWEAAAASTYGIKTMHKTMHASAKEPATIFHEPNAQKTWSSLLKQLLRFDPRWTIRLTGHSRCIGIPGAQTGQRDFATGGSLQRGVLTELACVRMLLCLLGALPFGHKEAFLSNCQLRCMLNCFCD